MVLRQAIVIAVSTVGIVLLTRTIGPEAYGVYAAGVGLYMYLFVLSQWGVEVYLIRYEGDLEPQDYHQAFSLLLLLGLAGAGVGLLALPLIERWVRLEGFGPVATALFVGLPVVVPGRVPQARLERALAYGSIASIETAVHIVFYLVALPLAYQGLGSWAPVGGWWAEEIVRFALLFLTSGYRPRLHWDSEKVRAMMRYGLGYSASLSVWQLRLLVNPLVVGRYAGADAVGYVALIIRIVEQLSAGVREVVWRLSIAALARLQGDLARLTRAVTEGMSLQVMALGPVLLAFGMVAPWIVPPLFGSRWLVMLEVFPFIALSYLSNVMFNLHITALYVLRRNSKVVAFNLLNVILFAGSALLLVSRLGVKGYGWAEVIALPSYLLLHIWFVAYVGRPKYTQAGVWFIGFAIPLFSWQLSPWVCVSAILPLMWPATRKQLVDTLREVVMAVQNRTHAP